MYKYLKNILQFLKTQCNDVKGNSFQNISNIYENTNHNNNNNINEHQNRKEISVNEDSSYVSLKI